MPRVTHTGGGRFFPACLGPGLRALPPARQNERGRIYRRGILTVWMPPDAPPLSELEVAVARKRFTQGGVHLDLLPPREEVAPSYHIDVVGERGTTGSGHEAIRLQAGCWLVIWRE